MLRGWSLLPREQRFYDRFEAEVQNLIAAATVLLDVMEHFEGVEEKVRQITELEHVGDDITHQIIAMVNKTFITPIDREDIALFAHSLDDVLDMIEAAADRMVVYGIEGSTPAARQLAVLILAQAQELGLAVPLLRNHAQLAAILPHAVEINRQENEADGVLREALKGLFRDQTRLTEDIRWREVYEHLEMATDRAEDVANVLEGIVLKHA